MSCRHPKSSTTSDGALQGSTVMRQSSAETLVTEEPYELIAHVRICGGAGRVTAGPTRKPTRRSARLRPGVSLHQQGRRQAEAVVPMAKDGRPGAPPSRPRSRGVRATRPGEIGSGAKGHEPSRHAVPHPGAAAGPGTDARAGHGRAGTGCGHLPRLRGRGGRCPNSLSLT